MIVSENLFKNSEEKRAPRPPAAAVPASVVPAVVAAPMMVWVCVVWAAVLSTVGATAMMFWLVQRREAGRVAPYFLLTPLVSCTIGVLFLGDRLSPQLLVGGGATMVGVALVARIAPAIGHESVMIGAGLLLSALGIALSRRRAS
jgi:drug/metabolite transporter (DMT)-like permease